MFHRYQVPCLRRTSTCNFLNFVYVETAKEPPPPAGFLAQCYLLYKRQLLSLKRDYTLLVVRLLCHLLIGVIFGYLYMGSGYRARGVLANYVYLYGSLLLIVYTGKMAVTLACKYLKPNPPKTVYPKSILPSNFVGNFFYLARSLYINPIKKRNLYPRAKSLLQIRFRV